MAVVKLLAELATLGFSACANPAGVVLANGNTANVASIVTTARWRTSHPRRALQRNTLPLAQLANQ